MHWCVCCTSPFAAPLRSDAGAALSLSLSRSVFLLRLLLGVQAAGELAMSLAEGGWGAPDLILCSDSRRTRQTFAAMQAAMPALSDVRTEFMGSFYIVSSLDRETRRHIEDAVCAVADSGEHSEEGCGDCGLRTVWAVGHNKGWSEAASELAGEAVQLVEASAVGLTREADSWEGALRESKGQWGIDAHFFVGGAGSAVEENSGGDGAPNGSDWPLPA